MYRNKKNGNYYDVITLNAICATNAYEGARLVVYTDQEKIYVRDYDEFMEKFEKADAKSIIEHIEKNDTKLVEEVRKYEKSYPWDY